MKKHSVLVLGLLAAVVGCGSGEGGGGIIASSGGHAGALVAVAGFGGTGGVTSGSAGTPGLGGTAGAAGAATSGAAGIAGTAGTAGTAGSAGAAGTAGTAGTATEIAGSGGTAGTVGTAGSGGSGGSGGTCALPSLVVFTRSDTNETWDDNDFDTVTLGADACPKQVNVTWPHEAGWENADPAESNHEVAHFTLDSDSSVDLSNKKLSLTIELASDLLGPAATAAAYSVSLVSVSTYDRVVTTGGAGTDAGGASGSAGGSLGNGGTGGSAGTGENGGASGGGLGGVGGDSTGGTGGAAVTTEIAYSEAESAASDRATLRFAGDRATVTFRLPNKTSTVSSYDPTRVIKINIRIYTTFSNGQSSGAGGTGAAGAASGGAGSAPVYDYLSSVFSISSFVIKDANAP